MTAPTTVTTASRRPRKRLISAELLKIRTTSTWWLFGIGMVLVTLLALGLNMLVTHFQLDPPLDQIAAEQQAQVIADSEAAHTTAGLIKIAANLLTSGQYLGVLFAMIIGTLVITNEYFHQTATATFMATPHRTAVVLAKLVAAGVFGGLFWLISTLINLVGTPLFLAAEGVEIHLTDWEVIQAVLLNLLAFVMWTIFGLGLGTLIRSQIGAVIIGIVVYLASDLLLSILVPLIHNWIGQDWVLNLRVLAPATASTIMITPGEAFPDAPPQWSGFVMMIAYVLVLGGLGILLTRRRDIS
ncbi:ABC transporter permease subunit [Luedemannella helvata]|uniref:ABC transporter permease n=1 Tax=Luedemannella helvata TaxID=349315 RepID=A0ABN2L1B5_9ACTN